MRLGPSMTPLEKIKLSQELIIDINKILSSSGIKKAIAFSDITITDKTVSDIIKISPKLSDAITEKLWPSIASATVYHYTSRESAESILKSGTFRLHSVFKRIKEDEILSFCMTHDLHGYLDDDEYGVPIYKSMLAPDLFYASFTEASIDPTREESMWQRFASCDGVRLKLEITANNPDLRKVIYEGASQMPIPVLAKLFNLVQEKYNKSFILKGISRLCAFYLPGSKYGIEEEVRMLYKVFKDFGPQPVIDSEWPYIELSLGVMSKFGYMLEITEVHSLTRPDMPNKYKFSARVA